MYGFVRLMDEGEWNFELDSSVRSETRSGDCEV